MRVAVEQGVPQEERQEAVPDRTPPAGKSTLGNAAATKLTAGKVAAAKPALANLTDWDAARIFLEVVRSGSCRAPADRRFRTPGRDDIVHARRSRRTPDR
jgi:hypothetical protein